MFNNIGGKIQTLASLIAGVGIFVSLLGGVTATIQMYDSFVEDFAFVGIIIGVVGALLSWISSFLLYGFGELIEQTSEINHHLFNLKKENDLKEKIEKFKQWKDQGLITDAEFIQKINSL